MKRDYGVWIVVINFLLSIQISEARYCPEAVDSVEYVVSCPSTKSEWDTAAQKKKCGKIALHQNCSSVDNFQYHCVINGFRNKMVEVCAPSRRIFGHCVEFNRHGGVIQDQMSSPCNNTFPKCDSVYLSTAAYEYPDCYDLVSKFSTKAETSAKITSLTKDKSRVSYYLIAFAGFVAVLVMSIVIVAKRKHAKQPLSTKKLSQKEMSLLSEL